MQSKARELRAALEVVLNRYNLEWNELTNEVELDREGLPPSFTDVIYNDLLSMDIMPIKAAIDSKLKDKRGFNSFHPIVDVYNKYHNDMNDADHIGALASVLNIDVNLFRKWYIGMIKAALDAGEYSNPVCLFLVGRKQGTGKTEFFRQLLPKELQRYFVDNLTVDIDDHDFALTSTSNILGCYDEFIGNSIKAITSFKSRMTSSKFTFRRKYDRNLSTTKRIATYCATANQEDILKDLTGNRRFLMVKVEEQLNFELYNSIDKGEAIAQAVEALKNGFNPEFTMEEYESINLISKDYQDVTYEQELVETYIDTPIHHNKTIVSKSELLNKLQGVFTGGRINKQALSNAMQSAGFNYTSHRTTEGGIVKGYKIARDSRLVGLTQYP